MLTRRDLLTYSVAASAVLAVRPWARAWAQPAGDATSFVTKLGNQLVAIVNGPGSYQEKKRKLGPLIDESVDVDAIARFCLGLNWRRATPEQQQQFTQLFHAVLLNNIADKLGQFQGVSFTPTSTTQQDGNSYVGTLIRRPNQQPNNVQWVVSQSAGRPKIIDVIAEGISLRVTQRDDYRAFISRNNNDVGALINAMKQQAAA